MAPTRQLYPLPSPLLHRVRPHPRATRHVTLPALREDALAPTRATRYATMPASCPRARMTPQRRPVPRAPTIAHVRTAMPAMPTHCASPQERAPRASIRGTRDLAPPCPQHFTATTSRHRRPARTTPQTRRRAVLHASPLRYHPFVRRHHSTTPRSAARAERHQPGRRHRRTLPSFATQEPHSAGTPSASPLLAVAAVSAPLSPPLHAAPRRRPCCPALQPRTPPRRRARTY